MPGDPVRGISLRASRGGGSRGVPKRLPMLSRAGDRGESTVTIGGDRCDGVTSSIDCGLALGGLGLRFRGPACSVPLSSVGSTSLLASPEDVRGRSLLGGDGADKDTCRFSMGEGGFDSVSFPRFSKRERSDETGLIEVESVLASHSAMIKT